MSSHKVLKILPPHPHLQNTLNKELGISKILAQVLVNRGIKSAAEAQSFLKVSLSDLHDPGKFSQMQQAVHLVKEKARLKEKVMIFGDYDVDGITSLALLKEVLEKMGLSVAHYLPHRVKDGYGLNKNILSLVKQAGAKLLITVDCGTNSHDQVKELKAHNIDVIITDHHEPTTQEGSSANALINPKAEKTGYPFRDLAGVGVTFKFAQALLEHNLFEYLELVALGTIADVVPLTGENRIIVKDGLKRIATTRRPGLEALIESSGIQGKKITPTSVSFILGPRLNASGRIDRADTALELLLSQNKEDARVLAALIETHNRQRQKIEGKILEEAEELINKEVNFKEHRIIVLANDDWHQGVLGVVASKLADRFYRPTILISKSAGLCKGSGRSIKNFHLLAALLECKEFLGNFGGHANAVGLTVALNNIEDFRNRINSFAFEKLKLEDLLPSLEIDMELGLADINEGLIAELDQLEPYGMGNPAPLFYTRGLSLKSEPRVYGRDTLKFWVSDGVTSVQVIGFRMGSVKESLKSAQKLDLVYALKLDSYAGVESLLLEAKEIFF